MLKGELGGKRLMKYIDYLKNRGAMIQIDHPNHETYGSGYGYDVDFDLIEVINGRSQRTTCKRSRIIRLCWSAVARSWRRAVRISIADIQTVMCLITCWRRKGRQTRFWKAYARGGSMLATALDGPEISMVCSDAVMGATVTFTEGQTIDISIKNLPAGSSVKVYTNNGLYSETAVTDNFLVCSNNRLHFCAV